MNVPTVRFSFCRVVLGLVCILCLSGCYVMELNRPLPEANEFQDANLDGFWVWDDDKAEDGDKTELEEKVIFAIEPVGKHHYSIFSMSFSFSFTISQIQDGKHGPFRFACITINDYEKTSDETPYMLFRYTSSSNQIRLYTITNSMQYEEGYKKLCQDPSRPGVFTAETEDIKKWCLSHAKEMKLELSLKRVHFKTDLDCQRFLLLSKFLCVHYSRVKRILNESKEELITDKQQREIQTEFEIVEKWLSDSKEIITPELTCIFKEYLSMKINGGKSEEVYHAFDRYMNEISEIALKKIKLK